MFGVTPVSVPPSRLPVKLKKSAFGHVPFAVPSPPGATREPRDSSVRAQLAIARLGGIDGFPIGASFVSFMRRSRRFRS